MKKIASLLLFAIASQLAATPLQDWKVLINQPIENGLPPLWVTWDDSAESKTALRNKNWKRYYEKREYEAERHQVFLRQITGDSSLTLDEDANRVDNSTTDFVVLSAKELLLAATDPSSPFAKRYRTWTKAESCKAARTALAAFDQLIQSTKEALKERPNQQLINFAKELADARRALQAFDQSTTSPDQLRALRRFVERYAN